MSLFDEDFIKNLSNDPKVGLHSLCDIYTDISLNKLTMEDHLEVYVLIEALISANDLGISVPSLPADRQQKIKMIQEFAIKLEGEMRTYARSTEDQQVLHNLRSKYSTQIGKAFVYEFSEGDLERIQVLLNEMRDLVTSSTYFEEKHKRRLLSRLERLQKELHKKQSDLDHYWGLVGDGCIALGKAGKDAKPFVDRVREIANIVWRTQSRAEELPSDAKPALLSDASEEEN